jgi:hypothetical protein
MFRGEQFQDWTRSDDGPLFEDARLSAFHGYWRTWSCAHRSSGLGSRRTRETAFDDRMPAQVSSPGLGDVPVQSGGRNLVRRGLGDPEAAVRCTAGTQCGGY